MRSCFTCHVETIMAASGKRSIGNDLIRRRRIKRMNCVSLALEIKWWWGPPSHLDNNSVSPANGFA
jgi:hypothetical protein